MASNNNVASHDQKASNQPGGSTEFQLKKYLLLLATLVATVTYGSGLNLPGGVWQDTQDGLDGHLAGDPILPDTHNHLYLAFYYCNATAFAASLVVCLLLLVLDVESTHCAAVLRVVMVLDLLGLMGAYAAGSCRDGFTTIYSSVVMSSVFTYIVLAFFAYVVSMLHKKQNEDPEKHHKDPDEQRKQDEDTAKRHKDTAKRHKDTEEHKREVLMLLATFAVTITYVAGLNPPGGFWANTQGGHRVSDPVLQDLNSSRYRAFFVCNTTAFVASLLIIMLLLDKKLSSEVSVRFVALYGSIVIVLFGLVGAYAAGSCREADNTAYVVCLIGAVLAYIFLQVAITKAIHSDQKIRIYDTASEWLQKIRKFFGSESHTKPDPDLPGSKDTKHNKALEKAYNLVMLLATLVASITYQAGLDPPGGLWPDDRDGHHEGGDPVLLTTHPARYKVFFYSNSAAFVASLVVIMMVQSRFLLKRHTLEAAMLLDLFGLIGAYAAGSCRDVSTSIYVVALAGAVLVYVVIHIVFFTLDDRENHQDADELDDRREVLLLLAILAATLTYQAGLTPPGGFWSSDDKFGHHAGFPVLLDYYPERYKAFFYCNATSFMASVALIVLLVNPNLYRPGIRCYALYVCMVAGMFGLMGAYAAGSSRHLRTSIYVLTLVAAVFAFVTLQVVVFWIRNRRNKTSKSRAHQTGNGSPGQESGSDALFEAGAHGTGKESSKPGAPNPKTGNGSSRQGGGSNASSEPGTHDTTGGEGSSAQGGSSTASSEPAAHVHDTTKEGSSAQGGSSNSNASSEREDHDTENESSGSGDKDLGEYLMLIGVLAASVTYQTGLKPPGGLWQDNGSGHSAGNSILHDVDKRRYHAFFYSNSTSFMASIVVIVLLLRRMLHDDTLPLWPMHTAILLDMLGLLGAYAAGSTREWETSRNVIALVVPVLAYIAAYAAVSLFRKKGRCHKGNSASTTPNDA